MIDRRGRSFHVDGFCLPCSKRVRFLVDYRASETADSGPNWREVMICPCCRMSNRQRLMASLATDLKGEESVYVMEQTTPLYRWLRSSSLHVTGSEFFEESFSPGVRVMPFRYMAPVNGKQLLRSLYRSLRLGVKMILANGIRHEDATHLSLPDAHYDLIVSNDVFEHVPSPIDAFSECARVLKPGGRIIATFPFHSDRESSLTRARPGSTGIEYIEPPLYHGNPISDEGSLVYTDFGWDLIDMMNEVGFDGACLELYRDPELGHRGPGLVVIRATRSSDTVLK